MPDKNLYPVEAAAFLHITPGTLANWRSWKTGPKFTKLGDSPKSRIIYKESDLKKWMADREVDNG